MTRFASLFAPAPPTVAVEIGSRHVTVVRMATSAGAPAIAALAVEPLPPGAVVPALNDANIADRPAVVEALTRAVDRAGSRRRRAVLVVPDSVGKVSLLQFEKVPERSDDLAELVRWQTRKSVPFRIEDAQLTYAPAGPAAEASGTFAVVLARRDIVTEYETVCEEAGVHVGVVDLATFDLIDAAVVASEPRGDWLLVHAAAGYLSLAILRDRRLLFFRHRDANAADSLEDVVHQTAMYYEDRLSGGGFSRIVLASEWQEPGRAVAAGGPQAGDVRRQLEQRLGMRVDSIDPRPAVAVADRIAIQPSLLDAVTPAVGLLLRERSA